MKHILSFFLLSFLLLPFAALAVYDGGGGKDTVGLVPCSGTDCTLCDLWQLGSNVINFMVWSIAIPLGVILFVVAGLLFIVAGGNEQKVTKARGIFFNTVIGVALIFCSWLIVDTIFKTLAGDGFIGAWNQFPQCH